MGGALLIPKNERSSEFCISVHHSRSHCLGVFAVNTGTRFSDDEFCSPIVAREKPSERHGLVHKVRFGSEDRAVVLAIQGQIAGNYIRGACETARVVAVLP